MTWALIEGVDRLAVYGWTIERAPAWTHRDGTEKPAEWMVSVRESRHEVRAVRHYRAPDLARALTACAADIVGRPFPADIRPEVEQLVERLEVVLKGGGTGYVDSLRPPAGGDELDYVYNRIAALCRDGTASPPGEAGVPSAS